MDPLPYNVTISSQTASIVYAPNRDGDPTAGWNVTYSSGTSNTGFGVAQGVGTDSHWTTHDGASLQLSWVGTAIYLYGDASPASYSIDVDGASAPSIGQGGILGSKTGLDYGNHTVTLTTHGTDQVSFQYAEATIGVGYSSGSSIQNQTIFAVKDDDTTPNPFFNYVFSPDANTWHVEDAKFVLQANGTTTPFPRQMLTADPGDSVSFTLSNTSAFFLYGAVNSDHHPKTVSIVPASNANLIRRTMINDYSSALDFKQILYWESGLDRDETYTVRIAQIGPGETSLSFSSLDIIDGGPVPSNTSTTAGGTSTGAQTASQGSQTANQGSQTGLPSDPSDAVNNQSAGLSTGVIVGIAVISGAALLLASIAALLFWRHSKQKRRKVLDDQYKITSLPFSSEPSTPLLATPPKSPGFAQVFSSAPVSRDPDSDTGPRPSNSLPPQYDTRWVDRRAGTGSTRPMRGKRR
ncbi:hypothetical protein EIP91_009293 [Steccherinum ochraceum]|uniref:Uncharacterized protein n=1 Tax=Steccherinum ochraceum TaxID=92696 RepID=A0A4R0R1T1_9APHY|nr:hypothetical protein EIP91_009293 [Steccherinum ochraceum]